jgi:hypothetical protein
MRRERRSTQSSSGGNRRAPLVGCSGLLGRFAGTPISSSSSRMPIGQDLFDLVERFPAKVLRPQHLGFGFNDQFSDRSYVRILQAVVRTNGKFEFIHGSISYSHVTSDRSWPGKLARVATVLDDSGANMSSSRE